jgi:hypothetical protein
MAKAEAQGIVLTLSQAEARALAAVLHATTDEIDEAAGDADEISSIFYALEDAGVDITCLDEIGFI